MEYAIKLSPYAKIFYNEWLLAPESSTYNISIDQILHGNLDVNRLKKALNRYIAEHVLLNSHIQEIDEEPHWVKNNAIKELEYSDNPIDKSELLNYVTNSFNLYTGPLYRFKLIRLNTDAHRFIAVFHHLVVDGSKSLDPGVFQAIANYYNNENYTAKYSINEQIELISNLACELTNNLNQNEIKYKNFWRTQLSDVENIDLTFLKLSKTHTENNADESFNPIQEITFKFNYTELVALSQLKNKYAITPYIYGQCIFALLLHKYTGQERLAISYPVAIKEGIDFIYGAQINTNLIPYQFNKLTTIVDLFNQNQDFFKLTLRDNIKYGYCPIYAITNDNKNSGLLNISFAQTFFREAPFAFTGIKNVETIAELSIDGVAKDTLLFEHDARNNKLNYRVRYDERTINKELLNNFINSYKKLFIEVLADLTQNNTIKQIATYNLLNEKQYQQLVYEFNQTEKDYPQNKTIHELFEERAGIAPNNIAIMYGNTKPTIPLKKLRAK